jgi:hypothetical protein
LAIVLPLLDRVDYQCNQNAAIDTSRHLLAIFVLFDALDFEQCRGIVKCANGYLEAQAVLGFVADSNPGR